MNKDAINWLNKKTDDRFIWSEDYTDIPLALASLISRFWDLSMYLACSSTLNLKNKSRISLCACYSSIHLFFQKALTKYHKYHVHEVKQKNVLESFLTWSSHSSASVHTLPPSFWLPVLYDGGRSLCPSLSDHSVFFPYNVG